MSTKYDVARPAKRVPPGPIDPALLHMGHQKASYPPTQSNQSSSRHAPANFTSQSLPQSSSSWLSDAADSAASPLSQVYLGVGTVPRSESIHSSGELSELSARSMQRARSRDCSPSASLSPPFLSTSGSHSPRHSPSPVPLPSHTLHTSRSFSSVSPHKTSASSPDASGHLDLKRLLSKPAMQTASSSVSLMSDPERSGGEPSSSRLGPARRPSESPISRPPLSRSAHASREKLSLHVNTTGLRSLSAPRQGHSSSPERKEPADENPPGKSSRNVLRRRPSARSNPNTPTIHPFRSATDDIFILPARAASIKHSHHHQPHPGSSVPLPPHVSRPLGSPSPLAPRPATSPRPKTMSSPNSPQVHIGLTPASAVALAYKQQEQRREELAETASFNDAFRPSSATPLRPTNYQHQGSNNLDGDEETSGPYYTVFGSTSGRLVAVGSPEDDDIHYGGYDPRAAVTSNAKQHSASGSRSLSRKVSGSFKRVAGSIKRNDRDHREFPVPSRDEWKPYDGSKVTPTRDPSAQDQSHSDSQTPSKSTRRPTALDMAVDGRNSPRESPTARFSPSTKNSPSPREGGRPSQSSKLRGKEQEEETSPGSRWWRLMKRISTGGLREKYNASDMPPPVPALPANLKASIAPSRMTMDISSRGPNGDEVSENGVLLRKFMQSRSSLSGVRPSLSPPPRTPPSTGSSRPSTGNTNTAGRPSTGNTTKSRASTSQRPSTTRSSSPGSSEVATSSLFNHNRTPSTRSSFSSFGEEIPPLPKPVGQYIIPPSELSRMTRSSESARPSPSPSQHKPRTRTQSRSYTAPPEDLTFKGAASSPEDRSIPSLPLPPRRNTTSAAVSPIVSSFNVEDTINKFMPPHASVPPPLGEFGVKEPPPRPKRSSRRAAPPNVDVPARSQSMSTVMPPTPRTPRGPPQVRVDVDLVRRPSTGALSYASTARQPSATSSNSPASALTSPSSAVSQKRSPLTFRELESPRQRLTEKEKADKWEDLLERSAQAGGTLHLGESRLMSEDVDINGDESFFDGDDSDA